MRLASSTACLSDRCRAFAAQASGLALAWPSSSGIAGCQGMREGGYSRLRVRRGWCAQLQGSGADLALGPRLVRGALTFWMQTTSAPCSRSTGAARRVCRRPLSSQLLGRTCMHFPALPRRGREPGSPSRTRCRSWGRRLEAPTPGACTVTGFAVARLRHLVRRSTR